MRYQTKNLMQKPEDRVKSFFLVTKLVCKAFKSWVYVDHNFEPLKTEK